MSQTQLENTIADSRSPFVSESRVYVPNLIRWPLMHNPAVAMKSNRDVTVARLNHLRIHNMPDHYVLSSRPVRPLRSAFASLFYESPRK